MALAVPWVGTLQPLPLLAGMSGWKPLKAAQTQAALGRSWAAFDLLPPDPAPGKTDMTGVDLFHDAQGHAASPVVATAWIPAGPAGQPLRDRARRSDQVLGRRSRTLDLGNVEVVNVAGWREDTLSLATMDAQGRLGFNDGPEGDGTVPRASVVWVRGPRVRTVGGEEGSRLGGAVGVAAGERDALAV